MGQAPFSTPVFLKLSSSGNFRASSPAEAAQYLDYYWQGERTPHYRQAKVLCHAAAEGVVSAETARIALVDAAQRCGVLADGRLVDGLLSATTYVAAPELQLPAVRDGVDDDVTDADFVGYYRAADILSDPALSPSRKRALLAHWASDLHSVAGAPALRSLRGVTVTVDSLLDALCELDAEVDQAAMITGDLGRGQSW